MDPVSGLGKGYGKKLGKGESIVRKRSRDSEGRSFWVVTVQNLFSFVLLYFRYPRSAKGYGTVSVCDNRSVSGEEEMVSCHRRGIS